jgi:hypothetical protein
VYESILDSRIAFTWEKRAAFLDKAGNQREATCCDGLIAVNTAVFSLQGTSNLSTFDMKRSEGQHISVMVQRISIRRLLSTTNEAHLTQILSTHSWPTTRRSQHTA